MRALIFCFLLAGCASTAPASVQVNCLPIRTYTVQEQKALAEAIAPLAPTSPLVVAMLDYSRMRDASRACAASQGKTK